MSPENRQKNGESRAGEQPSVRDLKKSRYETEDYGDSYDRRYCSGLNEVNTVVERGWIARRLEGELILDAGAGTGRFAAFLEARGKRVVALDSSAQMMAKVTSISCQEGT